MLRKISDNLMLKEESHEKQIFLLVFLLNWTMIWMNNLCKQASLLNSKRICKKI